jgi:peptidoglycan/LPS O-acetylase OafA/YrhL
VTQAFRTFKPLGSCQSLSHIYLLSGCADAIAMGCLAAMVTAYRLRLPSRSGLTLQVLGVGTIAWRYWYWPVTTDHIMGPSIIAFGAAIFLFGACLPARGHYTGWTSAAFFPLRIIGRRSYEIYLLHMPLIVALQMWVSPATYRRVG